MLWSGRSLNLFALSSIVNFILSLPVGLLVIFKNFRSSVNRSFFYLTLTVEAWTFFAFLAWSEYNPGKALLYARIMNYFSLFLLSFFFILPWFLPLNLNRKKNFLKVFIQSLSFCFFWRFCFLNILSLRLNPSGLTFPM